MIVSLDRSTSYWLGVAILCADHYPRQILGFVVNCEAIEFVVGFGRLSLECDFTRDPGVLFFLYWVKRILSDIVLKTTMAKNGKKDGTRDTDVPLIFKPVLL